MPIYLHRATFVTHWQNWAAVTEVIRLAKSKMLILCPFTFEVCRSLFLKNEKFRNWWEVSLKANYIVGTLSMHQTLASAAQWLRFHLMPDSRHSKKWAASWFATTTVWKETALSSSSPWVYNRALLLEFTHWPSSSWAVWSSIAWLWLKDVLPLG